MQLTVAQHDALTELINIGYGRAAGALSDLTRHRIALEVPRVGVYPMPEVVSLLSESVTGEVVSVHQLFSGTVGGNALLLMDHDGATLLNRLLTDDPSAILDASGREVLIEVGNIVLNACLGVFGNLLKVQVSFTVPRLHLDSLGCVLTSITIGERELQYGMLIKTKFSLRESDISGFLVIILGVTSLDRLLQELDAWEQSQTR